MVCLPEAHKKPKQTVYAKTQCASQRGSSKEQQNHFQPVIGMEVGACFAGRIHDQRPEKRVPQVLLFLPSKADDKRARKPEQQKYDGIGSEQFLKNGKIFHRCASPFKFRQKPICHVDFFSLFFQIITPVPSHVNEAFHPLQFFKIWHRLSFFRNSLHQMPGRGITESKKYTFTNFFVFVEKL
jgi:hypothetical protein